MIRKHWFYASLALGAAVLPAQGHLQAQSSHYGVSLSPLPAHVGQPLTVTVPVPATVPDGTAFTYSAYPLPYTGASAAYLQASGVSANHKFTVQLPALTISGLYEISVGQAQGSTSVGSMTPVALNAATVDLLVSPAGQNPNSLATLTGDYAFLFKGQTKAAPGVASGAALVGTFTADGNGKIVSGVADLNTAAGIAFQNAAVTGSYQLDASGKGSLLLTTPRGVLSFNIVVPPAKPGVLVSSASLAPSGGFTGTGEISRVQSFFNYGIVFNGQAGYATEPLTTSAGYVEESSSGVGFQAGAGLLAFKQDLTLSGVSQAVPGVSNLFAGIAGTYLDQSATGPFAKIGRSILTLSAPGLTSMAPTHFAFYQGSIGSSGMYGVKPVLYFLSLDPHPATDLVVGKIQY